MVYSEYRKDRLYVQICCFRFLALWGIALRTEQNQRLMEAAAPMEATALLEAAAPMQATALVEGAAWLEAAALMKASAPLEAAAPIEAADPLEAMLHWRLLFI